MRIAAFRVRRRRRDCPAPGRAAQRLPSRDDRAGARQSPGTCSLVEADANTFSARTGARRVRLEPWARSGRLRVCSTSGRADRRLALPALGASASLLACLSFIAGSSALARYRSSRSAAPRAPKKASRSPAPRRRALAARGKQERRRRRLQLHRNRHRTRYRRLAKRGAAARHRWSAATARAAGRRVQTRAWKGLRRPRPPTPG